MQIVVVPYHFLGRVMKFVKILRLQFFKIDLDTISEIKVFIVCGYIQIKLMYCVLVDYVMVSCLKVKSMSKKGFSIGRLVVAGWDVGEGF